MLKGRRLFVCMVSLLFCALATSGYSAEGGFKSMVLKDLKSRQGLGIVTPKDNEQQNIATLMIPETQSSDVIFLKGSDKPIKLGFTLRCNQLSLKGENSSVDVTVLEKGNVILSHTIGPGDPLRYGSYTFRLETYESYRDFILQVKNTKTDSSMTKITVFQKKVFWQEEGVSIGIINAGAVEDHVTKVKIWFSVGKGAADLFWLPLSQEGFSEIEKRDYTIKVKQLYSAGLVIKMNH